MLFALLLAVAVCSVVAGYLLPRVLAWRGVVRRRVVVNLHDQAFSGLLWAHRGPLLVLRQAQILTPTAPPQDLDGEVVIELGRVEFIQIVPGG